MLFKVEKFVRQVWISCDERCKKALFVLFYPYASVAEWSIAIDCKSIAFGLRRFESYPAHNLGWIEAKSLFRPFTLRLFFGSNRSISGMSSFSPFFSTENQERKSIKSFLDLMQWFEPKLENISRRSWLSPWENAILAL